MLPRITKINQNQPLKKVNFDKISLKYELNFNWFVLDAEASRLTESSSSSSESDSSSESSSSSSSDSSDSESG